MPKKCLIALPEAMFDECDYIAQAEHRTRADLIREALRRYIYVFRQNHQAASLKIQSLTQPVPAAKADAIEDESIGTTPRAAQPGADWYANPLGFGG